MLVILIWRFVYFLVMTFYFIFKFSCIKRSFFFSHFTLYEGNSWSALILKNMYECFGGKKTAFQPSHTFIDEIALRKNQNGEFILEKHTMIHFVTIFVSLLFQLSVSWNLEIFSLCIDMQNFCCKNQNYCFSLVSYKTCC